MAQHADVDFPDAHNMSDLLVVKVFSKSEVEDGLIAFRQKCERAVDERMFFMHDRGGRFGSIGHIMVKRDDVPPAPVMVDEAEPGNLEQPRGEFCIPLLLISRQRTDHFNKNGLCQVFCRRNVPDTESDKAENAITEEAKQLGNTFGIACLRASHQFLDIRLMFVHE